MRNYFFFLCIALLGLCACDDEEEYPPLVGPHFYTTLYVQLEDEAGDNLFDSEEYDLERFYISYLRIDPTYGRTVRAEEWSYAFVKGKETVYEEFLEPEETYLELGLDMTKCGYPFYLDWDYSVESEDGTFFLEYEDGNKDIDFAPIHFTVAVTHFPHTSHYWIKSVTGDNIVDTVEDNAGHPFVVTLRESL